MPIPRATLQKAQQPLEERILAFLASKSEEAYSEIEISAAVEGYAVDALRMAVVFDSGLNVIGRTRAALERLVAARQVEVARYQEDNYYAVARK